MKKIILLVVISLFHGGCDDSATSPEAYNYVAPSRETSLSAILDYQKISSIKFFIYDSSEINGESKGNFKLTYEVYYDFNRNRIIQYLNNEPWLLSIDDFNKNIFWS